MPQQEWPPEVPWGPTVLSWSKAWATHYEELTLGLQGLQSPPGLCVKAPRALFTLAKSYLLGFIQKLLLPGYLPAPL